MSQNDSELCFQGQGNALVKEIADMFNSAAPDGTPYFSEDEKADGRNIVTTTHLDETGINELGQFRDFIKTEFQKRFSVFQKKQKPEGLRKAA
jgi:hypothetical protein